MDGTAVFRMLLRRWYLLVLPSIAAAVVVVPDLLARPAGSTGYTAAIRYTAAQVLEAIPARDGDYQDVWLASELTIDAFTEWIRNSRFIEAVRAELAPAPPTHVARTTPRPPAHGRRQRAAPVAAPRPARESA